MVSKWRRSALSGLALMVIVCGTGCGSQSSATRQEHNLQGGVPSTLGVESNRAKSEAINGKMRDADFQGGSFQVLSAKGTELTLPIVKINQADYLIGADFAKLVGYESRWEPSSGAFALGDRDAAYELKVNQTTAQRDDETLTLPQAPVLHNAQFHIPVSALSLLFSEEISFDVRDNTFVLKAEAQPAGGSIDGPDEANTGAELDFEDDPNDPFKGEEPAMAQVTTEANGDGQPVAPVLKNIDMNGLISRAKRYLGVKYLFGAGPYPNTGRFDCSTYTQYLYDKNGVELKRTARAQARQGSAISRKQLRRGDLMFFYVPGRFRTNKIVGHVGIYMGNQRMIHASPEPKNGVQISNINKAYWKTTFLRAKRMAY